MFSRQGLLDKDRHCPRPTKQQPLTKLQAGAVATPEDEGDITMV